MNQPKRQFRSILNPAEPDITEIMNAVNTATHEHDIPSLVRPSDANAKSPTTEGDDAPADSNVTPLTTRRAKKVNPAPTQKKTMELPTYLWDELRLISAKEKKAQRYLVLKAFKDAGYNVHDVDLFEDGRRAS